jgi:hypothetical protein
MVEKTVNLAGIPTRVQEELVDIASIELDPDNPRIGLQRDSALRDLTQEKIQYILSYKNSDAYRKLKESVEINHGIIYPIWIASTADQKYVVIEGNTRLVIYRDLAEKYSSEPTYKKILSIILPGDVKDNQKDFIRLEAHLRGTTDWDAYEKARYLYKLFYDEGLPISQLEKLTKLTYDEIDNSIKAFKDMEQCYMPTYGKDQSSPFKFSYFVEYEKSKKLKSLMEKAGKGIEDFCTWVGEGKLSRAQDVRDLPSIFSFEASRDAFEKEGYDEALEKLEVLRPDKTSRVFQNIERVIQDLREMPAIEVSEMREGIQPEKKRMLEELSTSAISILKMVERK